MIGPDGTTDPVTAGGGSSHVTASSIVSPLRAITTRAGSRAAVTSYSGSDPTRAAAAAARAQVAIVFASYSEREDRDLKSISLPGKQNAMIKSVAAANPNTIIVLNTGGPVSMPWLSSVKGVLEAWYPGQEDGRAIAAVLFGDIDPSGHLPETFPTSLSEIPTASRSQFPGVDGRVDYSEALDVGYRWYDARHVTPLFPFGYGLSYTRFSFKHLTVTPKSVVNSTSGPDSSKGQSATVAKVTAVIMNTGNVRGSDVAQLYIRDPALAGEPPRQLEGFHRVTLQPHQSQTVIFTITGHELSYFNVAANGWTLPTGRFSLYVGDSSALTALPLSGNLDVRKTIGNRYVRLSAPRIVEPGATFTAKAEFVNHGNLPITDGTVRFEVPSSWTLVPLDGTPALSLAPGQSATRYFRVTTPESAEGEVKSLTAQLTSADTDNSGDLSASATVSVPGPITVRASSPAVVAAGGSATAEVAVTSHMSQAVVVDLTPAVPSGVTIAPTSPAVAVPANSTVNLMIAVAVAPGTSPRAYHVPLGPSFTYDDMSYPMAAAGLTVEVPYASLHAAYDSRAISDNSDIAAARLRRLREQLLRGGSDRCRTRPRRDSYRRCYDPKVARCPCRQRRQRTSRGTDDPDARLINGHAADLHRRVKQQPIRNRHDRRVRNGHDRVHRRNQPVIQTHIRQLVQEARQLIEHHGRDHGLHQRLHKSQQSGRRGPAQSQSAHIRRLNPPRPRKDGLERHATDGGDPAGVPPDAFVRPGARWLVTCSSNCRAGACSTPRPVKQ